MTETVFSNYQADIARARTAADAYESLYRLVSEVIGVKLFTVMTVDMTTTQARRAFTSDPVNYPVSGEKKIEINRWFKIIHDRREIFCANSIEEIDTVFPDADLIEQLGCGSVVNIPMFLDDQWLGSVNLLHEPGYFTTKRLASVDKVLGQPLELLMYRLRELR